MAFEYTKRDGLNALKSQMSIDRSSFVDHWRDCGDYISPRRPRFLLTDVNKGDKRNQKIVDGTGTNAASVLEAGMMGGITSPARPWYELTTADDKLGEIPAVKVWLDQTTKEMNAVFAASNLYNGLPTVYGDMGTFGQGGTLVEEDFEDVIRLYDLPVGSYMISNNARGKIDTFMREFQMSVRQIVEKFGTDPQTGMRTKDIDWTNISKHVKQLYETGHAEMQIGIAHCIKPNDDYDPDRIESKYKRYMSCYWELGVGPKPSTYEQGEESKFLSEKGYDQFPVLVARWKKTGEDAYANNCPGMTALGDIKQLQFMEKRSAKALDKMIDPPMKAPMSMKTQRTSILAGDISYLTDQNEGNKFEPAQEVKYYQVEGYENKAEQLRRRIKEFFFVDLFRMMIDDQRNERPTAAEVYARQQEKLLALGPVLEQLNQDFLDPLIDLTFDFMVKQGRISQPPAQLLGVKLKVKYVSVMAQAQKLVGVSGVERLLGFVLQIASVLPEAVDKINSDKMIESYGEMTSAPFGVVRTDDDVAVIRAQRAKQAQQQHAADMALQASAAAKNLSGADLSGDNALQRMSQAGQLVQQS